MRKALLLWVGVVCVLGGTALAQEDQAYFAIFADTSVVSIPGMPEIPDLPDGMDPAMLGPMAAMFAGGVQRTVEMRLWSPGVAPENAFARVRPPAGLGVGNLLELQLHRPGEGPGTGDVGEIPDFTMKFYWGSSKTVREGQPRILRVGDMTEEQRAAMQAMAAEAQSQGGGLFYKAGWTTAAWPTPRDPGTIQEDASLVGAYTLETNYTGGVTIEAPANVDFLDPFTITAPDLEEGVDLEESVTFEWEPIAKAIGIHAGIFGMEGENTLVLWSSSETFDEAHAFANMGYLDMAEVRRFVEEGVFLPGDATTVTVPEGIFGNCMGAVMMMVGYGPGAALGAGQPLPRIQTKSSLMMMLGMGETMGMMGGM